MNDEIGQNDSLFGGTNHRERIFWRGLSGAYEHCNGYRAVLNANVRQCVQASVEETGEIVAIKKVLQDKRFKVGLVYLCHTCALACADCLCMLILLHRIASCRSCGS